MTYDIALEGSAKKITRRDIEREEARHGFQVPDEYRKFLLQHNGGHPQRCCFRFGCGPYTDSVISHFLAIGGPGHMNLAHVVEVYADRLPPNYFPIATDPGGNLIVISCDGTSRGIVYFWDHEKFGKRSVRRVAGTFDKFLSMLTEENDEVDGDLFPVIIFYKDGSSQRLEKDARMFSTKRNKVVNILDLKPGEGIELFGKRKKIRNVKLSPRSDTEKL